jgi:hypothetical protein
MMNRCDCGRNWSWYILSHYSGIRLKQLGKYEKMFQAAGLQKRIDSAIP